MSMYRNLSANEQAVFRTWARENYNPFDPINGTWHPVVQDECVRMNAEAGFAFDPIAATKKLLAEVDRSPKGDA